MAAVRLHMERGNSTERWMPRRKLKTTAKFEITEPCSCRIAVVERRNRSCGDLNARRRGGIAQHIGQRESAGGQRSAQRYDIEPAAARRHQATRLRKRERGRSATACSSNNSASFSVMAPP